MSDNSLLVANFPFFTSFSTKSAILFGNEMFITLLIFLIVTFCITKSQINYNKVINLQAIASKVITLFYWLYVLDFFKNLIIVLWVSKKKI